MAGDKRWAVEVMSQINNGPRLWVVEVISQMDKGVQTKKKKQKVGRFRVVTTKLYYELHWTYSPKEGDKIHQKD